MDFPYRTASITSRPAGRARDGSEARVWSLENRRGMRAEVAELGGVVTRLDVVGGDLRKHDVALGPQGPDGLEGGAYLEAASRGGAGWPAAAAPAPMRASEEGRCLVMRGTVETARGPVERERRLALTDAGELAVGERWAPVDGGAVLRASDLPLPLPLYLNLAGQEPGNVLDTAVAADVSRFIDLSAPGRAPGGAAAGAAGRCAAQDAAGTPADFREGKALAEDILACECLGGGVAGFDLLLVLDDGRGEGGPEGAGGAAVGGAAGARQAPLGEEGTRGAAGLAHAGCASLYCGRSRVCLDVSTDCPALRLTTFQPAGGLPVPGKGGLAYGNHGGLAVEPAADPERAVSRAEPLETVAVYRFEPDFPEGYHTDSGCLDSIL